MSGASHLTAEPTEYDCRSLLLILVGELDMKVQHLFVIGLLAVIMTATPVVAGEVINRSLDGV